ncbi:hypothetical protein RND81_05G076200 [Saponaria officinalis]|uniref:Endonuclease/exonuclease/phosphatase domain-containing protein n=1 Tax=Saponaria officinalis TaxID=3572 RepID=A0AAW1KVV2_SAPOF
MEGVRKRIGGYEGVYSDACGRSAGVAILWKEGIRVEVISSTSHHLDVKITGLFGEKEWRLTGFYGWAATKDKQRSWQLLRDIKAFSTLPWLVIGDFNQILFKDEKKGGAPRSQREMDDFREAMDDCGLADLGYEGEAFTWWNKREEPWDIHERLDRAVSSADWMDLFPLCSICHLQRDKSDHLPIKLSIRRSSTRVKRRRFRFEDLWIASEECEEVVREAWSKGGDGSGEDVMLQKMEVCCRALNRLGKLNFGDMKTKIEEARKRLSFLDSCSPCSDIVAERKSICSKLDELVMMEEA